MKWDLKLATHQEELLFLTLCIVTVLLLLSFVRIALLLRQGRRMDEREAKLEKQILDQQRTIQDIRSDSNAWRGEMQRQSDAFRAESSKTIEAADLRVAEVQTRLDKSSEQHQHRVLELQASLDATRNMCAELPSAKARIIELEKQLSETEVESANASPMRSPDSLEALASAARAVSRAGLPVLPSIDAVEAPPVISDLPNGDDPLLRLRQRNHELERSLLLARRSKPVNRTKKDRRR